MKKVALGLAVGAALFLTGCGSKCCGPSQILSHEVPFAAVFEPTIEHKHPVARETWEIFLCDEKSAQNTCKSPELLTSHGQKKLTHTFDKPGTYLVCYTLEDRQGNIVKNDILLHIKDMPHLKAMVTSRDTKISEQIAAGDQAFWLAHQFCQSGQTLEAKRAFARARQAYTLVALNSAESNKALHDRAVRSLQRLDRYEQESNH